MYKYIKSSSETKSKIIDVVVVLQKPALTDAAASISLKQVYKEGDSRRLSNGQFDTYVAFLDTIESFIAHYFGKVDKSYQSPDSYSYYIQVSTQQPDAIYTFRVRVTDHKLAKSQRGSSNQRNNVFFSNIIVGKQDYYANYHSAVMAIDRICQGIVNGDPYVLNEDYQNRDYSKEDFIRVLDLVAEDGKDEWGEEEIEERNENRKNLYGKYPKHDGDPE